MKSYVIDEILSEIHRLNYRELGHLSSLLNEMAVKKVVKYVDEESGFEYSQEPYKPYNQEAKIIVNETPTGYTAYYLVEDTETHDVDLDKSSEFLVAYHEYFSVANDDVVTEEDIERWYKGEHIEQEKDWYIFPVKAYIHGNVKLTLGKSAGGWDSSQIGAYFVNKNNGSKEQARKYAENGIENWNKMLGGDIYIMVTDEFDKNKKYLSSESEGMFLGYEDAIAEMTTRSKA